MTAVWNFSFLHFSLPLPLIVLFYYYNTCHTLRPFVHIVMPSFWLTGMRLTTFSTVFLALSHHTDLAWGNWRRQNFQSQWSASFVLPSNSSWRIHPTTKISAMAMKSSPGQGQDVNVNAGNDSRPAELCNDDNPRPCTVLEAELRSECVLWNNSCTGNKWAAVDSFFREGGTRDFLYGQNMHGLKPESTCTQDLAYQVKALRS